MEQGGFDCSKLGYLELRLSDVPPSRKRHERKCFRDLANHGPQLRVTVEATNSLARSWFCNVSRLNSIPEFSPLLIISTRSVRVVIQSSKSVLEATHLEGRLSPLENLLNHLPHRSDID
jgi:hypothetical protein